MKINKVKKIYYCEDRAMLGNYPTGLILELQDGRFMAEYSTDTIQNYAEIDKSKLGIESPEPSASAREFWLWKNKDGWRVEENHTSEVIDSYGDKQKIIHVKEVKEPTEPPQKDPLELKVDLIDKLKLWIMFDRMPEIQRSHMQDESRVITHELDVVLFKITSLKKGE